MADLEPATQHCKIAVEVDIFGECVILLRRAKFARSRFCRYSWRKRCPHIHGPSPGKAGGFFAEWVNDESDLVGETEEVALGATVGAAEKRTEVRVAVEPAYYL